MRPINKQTPANELKMVSEDHAARLLQVSPDDLVYSSWPQTVKNVKGELETVTGEAWILAPDGRLDDGNPHPAVVFHRGVILGSIEDLSCLGGYLATRTGRGRNKNLAQITGFAERRVPPRRGPQYRNAQVV